MMEDPFETAKHGGTELEMEAVLAFLRTRDDLVAKAAKFREPHENLSGDDDGNAPASNRFKKKKKGDGKGDKGGANAPADNKK